MGVLDTEGKRYLSNSNIFADAFNFLLYDGEEVIKPDSLKELDTTGIVVPYGNKARVPEQKYRDLLKMWNVMMDDNAIYVILGAEIQGEIDMCLAMEKRVQKEKILGVIEGMRIMGASDNDIAKKIIEMFDVTKEYVMLLLTPQKV